MSENEKPRETPEQTRERLVREAREMDALEDAARELREKKTKRKIKNPPVIPTDPNRIKQ